MSAPTRPYRIIEAPSILGLKPSGVETLPERLLGLLGPMLGLKRKGRFGLLFIEGREPLVRPADAVVLGFRDHEEQIEYASQPLPPPPLRQVAVRIRYNPHLDADGKAGKVLADVIAQGLGTCAPGPSLQLP